MGEGAELIGFKRGVFLAKKGLFLQTKGDLVGQSDSLEPDSLIDTKQHGISLRWKGFPDQYHPPEFSTNPEVPFR